MEEEDGDEGEEGKGGESECARASYFSLRTCLPGQESRERSEDGEFESEVAASWLHGFTFSLLIAAHLPCVSRDAALWQARFTSDVALRDVE